MNIKINKKMNVMVHPVYSQIRVYHRKDQGKRGARYLLKCGCCNEKLEIYYDDDSLEINGVQGSIENWREILLPLLKMES